MVDDFMICRKTDCINLGALIRDKLMVKNLSINGIYFGDEKNKSVLEMSTDRSYLFIFTEDMYVSVAKMPVSSIKMLKFGIDDTEFEIYP